jgi:site-specific DNA-methyltransferase (adenine-specific)
MSSRKANEVDDRGPVTDLWWDIHRLKHNSRRVDHPCQLPPTLMRRLIAIFTSPDEVILDPFNGAGTTSLCAEQMDRRFIGVELSEYYHKLALSRHKLLRLGGDPFAKGDRVPKEKNSRVKRIGGLVYKVPKKALQLEVRSIAKKLGRIPTRDDVQRHSQHPIQYFDEYFINWAEVCAAARTTGMQEMRNGHKQKTRRAHPTFFDLS